MEGGQPVFDNLQERVREEFRCGGDRTFASILRVLADMPCEEAEKWVQVYNQSGDTADRIDNANVLPVWAWNIKSPS